MPIKKVAQIRSESGTKLVGQTCLADIGEPGQPDCWCLQPLYKPCCWGTLAYLCYKNCAKKKPISITILHTVHIKSPYHLCKNYWPNYLQ